jgi:hypothetical protein
VGTMNVALCFRLRSAPTGYGDDLPPPREYPALANKTTPPTKDWGQAPGSSARFDSRILPVSIVESPMFGIAGYRLARIIIAIMTVAVATSSCDARTSTKSRRLDYRR